MGTDRVDKGLRTRLRSRAVTIPRAVRFAVDGEAGGGAGQRGRDQVRMKDSRRNRTENEQSECGDFLPGHGEWPIAALTRHGA